MTHAMAAPAASALPSTIHNIVPQIKEIIEPCTTKTAGIMQPSVDKIVKLCLDSGLAVKRNVLGAELWYPPGEPSSLGGGPIRCTEPGSYDLETGLLGKEAGKPNGF